MSLARQFFHEMRPFFRLLEEPLGRSPAYMGSPRSLLDDSLRSFPIVPKVDVTEEGSKYIIEAEVPGIKKESLGVRVGEGGRLLTIEGKASRQGPSTAEGESSGAVQDSEGSTAVAARPGRTQLSVERSLVSGNHFTRTIYLTNSIDSNAVTASLNDGILTITAPKVEDAGTIQVPIQ